MLLVINNGKLIQATNKVEMIPVTVSVGNMTHKYLKITKYKQLEGDGIK